MVADLKEELTANLQRSLEEVVDLQAKLKGKCDELTSMASHVQELQKRVRDAEAKWNKEQKKGLALTAKMTGLNAELAKLRKVCRFHNVICVLFVLLYLCFILKLENEGATRERQKTSNIIESKVLAQQRNLASNECKYKKLEGQYNTALNECMYKKKGRTQIALWEKTGTLHLLYPHPTLEVP
jgi:hypothetical protein